MTQFPSSRQSLVLKAIRKGDTTITLRERLSIDRGDLYNELVRMEEKGLIHYRASKTDGVPGMPPNTIEVTDFGKDVLKLLKRYSRPF